MALEIRRVIGYTCLPQSALSRVSVQRLAWGSIAASLFGVVACTASWSAIVRYSDEPAAPTENVEQGVYGAVLRAFVNADRTEIVIVNDSGPIGPFIAWTAGSAGSMIPGYWADTLKREIRTALDSRASGQRADSAAVMAAADRTGIAVKPAVPIWTELYVNGAHPPTPRIRLGRPGFNGDSTIAAIEVTYWCGQLCGAGETLFLARRPGRAWQIFGGRVHWVS